MELDPIHRRIADEARERIRRIISGEALKDFIERIDTKAADAVNEEDE